jgi:hypothetical protein
MGGHGACDAATKGRLIMRTIKRFVIVVAATAATLLAWQASAAAASMVEYALL